MILYTKSVFLKLYTKSDSDAKVAQEIKAFRCSTCFFRSHSFGFPALLDLRRAQPAWTAGIRCCKWFLNVFDFVICCFLKRKAETVTCEQLEAAAFCWMYLSEFLIPYFSDSTLPEGIGPIYPNQPVAGLAAEIAIGDGICATAWMVTRHPVTDGTLRWLR